MSVPYVKYAKRHLKRWSRLNLTVGSAETLPVPDESQDTPHCFSRMCPGAEAWRASGPRGFAPARRSARL
jgi:hypothetical protein